MPVPPCVISGGAHGHGYAGTQAGTNPRGTTEMTNETPTTTRERREARAARLTTWAAARDARAAASLDAAHREAQAIPFGQPILVGHHSERADRRTRDRIAGRMGRAVEDLAAAERMRARAASIRAQAERAIYSDDEDAVERLAVKLEELEASRARVKAYNASCRRGAPDTSLLSEDERAQLLSSLQFSAHQCKGGAMPSWFLTNLTGRIAATRKRLAELSR
jgi:hypothetical protein